MSRSPLIEEHTESARRRFFERPSVKQAGVVGFALLVGLAVGNGWQTAEAMQDQKAWLDDRCGRTIKKKVQQTDARHIEEARQVFGFAPEDLKAPVPKR